MLKSRTKAVHLLDLLFTPGEAMEGKARVASSPFTYLNRIRLKRRLRGLYQGAHFPRRRWPESGLLGFLGRLFG